MKVTKEHRNEMKKTIHAKFPPAVLKKIEADYTEEGFSSKRFRWDIARAAGLSPFICDQLYTYCNDSHIDTAFRSIFNHKEN